MVKKKSSKIPKEDMEDINTALSGKSGHNIISKGPDGEMIGAKKKLVDSRGYEISDFRGRTLRHMKSVVRTGNNQITVGVKGQKFDDISPELRNMVTWFESDFEKE